MIPLHVVTITLTPGEVETGLWCDTCLLPSAITCGVYILAEDGPRRVATFRRCMQCED